MTFITKRPSRTIEAKEWQVTVYKYKDKETGVEVWKLALILPYTVEAVTTTATLGRVATVYKEREVTLSRYKTQEEAEAVREEINKAQERGDKSFRL